MKTTPEFFEQLKNLGITLSVVNEQLHCSAPKHAINNELKNELTQRKAELIEFIKHRKNVSFSDLSEINTERVYPLSFGQERLLSLQNIESKSGSSVYNISMAYFIKGKLQVDALEKSLCDIQKRHSILRTVFPRNNGNTVQKILDNLAIPISVINLKGNNPTTESIIDEMSELAKETFDLEQGPLWRCHILDYGEHNFGLLFTMHHMIFDGWSKKVFNEELAQFYLFHSTGHLGKALQQPAQYSMYSCWLRLCLPSMIKNQEPFWRSHISQNDSELRLPYDFKKANTGKSNAKSFCFNVPDEIASNYVRFTRSQNVSLNISLLSAFSLLLHFYTHQKNLIICSPMACRNSRKDLETAIGYFNNIVALNISMTNHESIQSLIKSVQETIINAFKNQGIPFQHVASLPNQSRIPLTNGLFSFQNTEDLKFKIPGLVIEPLEVRKQEADFDLALHLEYSGEILSGVLEYNAEIFSENTITTFIANFFTLLGEIASRNPQGKLPSMRFHKPYEEISNLLRKHDHVKDAVVTIDEEYKGPKNLVAYIIQGKSKIINSNDLREYLKKEGLPEYLIPATWIPVDLEHFPLDGDKIDFSALPSPRQSGRKPTLSNTPPQTDLQKQIAQIWEKILWMEGSTIGIKDNFFELGGHSLLAVQLIGEIENTLGKQLPNKALLQLSDIETLCNILQSDDLNSEPTQQRLLPDYLYHGLLAHTAGWQGQRVNSDSLLFGFNVDGKQQPLFWCIHGYRALTMLAQHIGADQPLYGMRSGHSIMEPTEENITILAHHYVTEIQAVQPKGPYLIGGNCHSGRIAFAIAKRLTELGEPISLLCLVEQFVPQDYAGRVLQVYARQSYFNPYRYCKNPETGWKKYYTGEVSGNIVPGPHGYYFEEPYIIDFAKLLNSEIAKSKNINSTNLLNKTESPHVLPDDAYRAEIRCLSLGEFDSSGKAVAHIMVKNVSLHNWHFDNEKPLELSFRWLYDNIDVLGWGERVPLTKTLEVNESTELELPIRLLNGQSDGQFRIEFDLIEDGVTWFKYKGSNTSTIKVNISTLEEKELLKPDQYKRRIKDWEAI